MALILIINKNLTRENGLFTQMRIVISALILMQIVYLISLEIKQVLILILKEQKNMYYGSFNFDNNKSQYNDVILLIFSWLSRPHIIIQNPQPKAQPNPKPSA